MFASITFAVSILAVTPFNVFTSHTPIIERLDALILLDVTLLFPEYVKPPYCLKDIFFTMSG